MNKKINKIKGRGILGLFIVAELVLFFLLASFFISTVMGGVGENVTVTTKLTVGNVYPQVLNVRILGDNTSVYLTGKNTTLVYCEALLVDYTNDTDINTVTAEFFENNVSNYSGVNDDNMHSTFQWPFVSVFCF